MQRKIRKKKEKKIDVNDKEERSQVLTSQVFLPPYLPEWSYVLITVYQYYDLSKYLPLIGEGRHARGGG